MCPICYEIKRNTIIQPQCNHRICSRCFIKKYFIFKYGVDYIDNIEYGKLYIINEDLINNDKCPLCKNFIITII